MYLKGLGVKQDRDEAIRWISKAAAQGDDDAQRALKRLRAARLFAFVLVLWLIIIVAAGMFLGLSFLWVALMLGSLGCLVVTAFYLVRH